jgi:hypothetical protein
MQWKLHAKSRSTLRTSIHREAKRYKMSSKPSNYRSHRKMTGCILPHRIEGCISMLRDLLDILKKMISKDLNKSKTWYFQLIGRLQ